MSNEEIKEYVTSIAPSATFDESGEWLNSMVEPGTWKELALRLRNGPLHFDYLFCLTCIDWKTHLTVVYHLSSTTHRHTIVVKAKLDTAKPEIETVSDIWRTAEFHEREVFELFGAVFLHHPDLRRLILTDDFEGFPLRKDFEDPINMIKL
ncbi:MAG: NADH-quinone oxidoreductase subunit C [Chitinophagaceae bacterium]|nr:NADH-quinone oxidoreductase subunit C [Chitinophagaceae bacterium]MDP1763244.1 NADH-quinone oxidoreductase subunit C [Sediminibacterium sp.]MDP1810347.1 NADH-quinone oxidoreductase subunit C [Sediminibacterium sp.]MDP3128519.1 NADH-quinone oxidoreductase subunit C [Sediminibacterium sp.]MDP3666363.1 NADH-quinone oxidoreductase subunit C [Sediminibacterium sp.]